MGPFFAENFWGIIGVGTVLVLVLLGIIARTGRLLWIYGLTGVVAITALLLIYESNTVTLREEIGDLLETIADDLETNDEARVVRHIASTAPDLRDHAYKNLRRIVIDRATVKPNLSVQTEGTGMARHAIAKFNAVLVVSERNGGVQHQLAPFFFVVDFVREGDQWRVTRYERHDPRRENVGVRP